MLVRTLSASAVLLLMAGCATREPQVITPWQIEPVFNVRHAFETSQAYYTLGRYHDGAKAWVKAVEAYRKAIAADARNIEAYNALGVALAQMGNHADSETTLRQAVALAPALAHVRSNLGYVLLLAGKPQEAATELQAAVRQDRGDTTAAANLREAQVQVQARESQAGAAAHATVTPAQPAPVLLASPIDTAPIAPLPVTAAAATPGPAAAPTSAQASQAPVVVMPAPANDQITKVAALRVFDQPNVASLQGSATTLASAAQVNPSTGATAPVAMAPDAGPAVMTMRAFEPAAAVASVVRPVEGVAYAVAARASVAQVAVAASAASFAPAVAIIDGAPVARLEVSNGNGSTGMAASVGRWLVQHGLSAARLTNQLPYTQQQTLVQYRNGHEQAAQRVVSTLPTSARLEVARDMQSDVRVVLGRDWLQFADCLALQSCQAKGTSVALARN